jgi:hypothetical protein
MLSLDLDRIDPAPGMSFCVNIVEHSLISGFVPDEFCSIEKWNL